MLAEKDISRAGLGVQGRRAESTAASIIYGLGVLKFHHDTDDFVRNSQQLEICSP